MCKDKKTIVFGVGADFSQFKDEIFKTNNVCALLDNDERKHGFMVEGLMVHHPKDIGMIEYDDILVTTTAYHVEIRKQLVQWGVPNEKIRTFQFPIVYIDKYLGGIAGKIVLDIGCGDGNEVKSLASQCMPYKIMGIDPSVKEPAGGDNWLISNGDAENLSFEDNTFDAVYSKNAFEHIKDIRKTLLEVKRVLKPQGRFYCRFGDIWTSIQGYHDNRDANLIQAMPPWCHLYMSDDELACLFQQNGFDNISWMNYIKNNLNHYSRTELVSFIMFSGMLVKKYSERSRLTRSFSVSFESECSDDIRRKVKRAGYKIEDLGVYGIEFILEKCCC